MAALIRPVPLETVTITQVLVPHPTATVKNRKYDVVDVRIENGIIADIGPKLPPVGEIVDGSKKLLLPGFVNAHTHSSEMWVRGLVAPAPLELWLADICDFGASHMSADDYYLAALLTGVETVLSGGTTVLDHVWLDPDNFLGTMDAVVRAYRDLGVRAVIAPLISDLPFPFTVITPDHQYPRDPVVTEKILSLMQQVVEKYHRPEEGISVGVGPTGIQRCSDELFKGCITLSEKYSLPRHSHVLETRQQRLLALDKYGGKTALQHLKELGWLNSATTCAHSIHYTDDDQKIVAACGSTIVHNPLSNLRLGSGICPVLKFCENKVSVAVGCDGSGSNDAQNVLEAVKIASMLQSITEPDYRKWLDPYEVLRMAAAGGARGIGMSNQIGTIEKGKKADLLLFDLTALNLLPHTDPVVSLVYNNPSGALHSVWVSGRRIVSHHKLRTVDVDSLRLRLMDAQQDFLINDKSPVPQLRNLIEEQYRKVMLTNPAPAIATPPSISTRSIDFSAPSTPVSLDRAVPVGSLLLAALPVLAYLFFAQK